MARLPHLSEQDLSVEDRHLLARPVGIHQVLANLPEVLRGVTGIGVWVRWNTQVDPRLRELVIVYVVQLCGCEYEYSHHVKFAQEFGATADDLHEVAKLGRGAPERGANISLGELEQLALRAAYKLTVDLALPDATWAGLVDKLGATPAAELVSTISYYGMVARLVAAFDIEVEPDYLTYLEQFPMPRGVGSDR
jgi:AhpD family alkylhydroperoxidase